MVPKNNYTGLCLVLSIIALGFFSFIFMGTSLGLNIAEIPLKSDLFDRPDGRYNFQFSGLSNGRYYVLLKLKRKEGVDPIGIVDGAIKSTRKFQIDVDLRDSKNTSLGKKIINRDANIPYAYSSDDIEMKLLPFNAQRGERYNLALTFQSKDHFFDAFLDRSNILLIQEDYDAASVPYTYCVHYISKIFVIGLFFLTLLLSFVLWKGKHKTEMRND